MLSRGLHVLSELNKLGRAAVNTLAAAARLPRTTTFRILETLRHAGFVERDEYDYYRPTIRVRTLSDGFDDEARMAHIAKPLLAKLRESVAWPVALATPAGATMLIRVTTPTQGDLRWEHYGVGVRIPMLASAAGRTYLAHCSGAQREALLEVLARSSRPEDRLARSRVEMDRLLSEIRSQGFGLARRTRRVLEETSLAVPVGTQKRIVAVLTIRFAGGDLTPRAAIEQFIPRLREIAKNIQSQVR